LSRRIIHSVYHVALNVLCYFLPSS
jgi:hypothetical protein